ncbi:UNVERIFIED_CONTAM: hypothetical protein PVV41_26340, partial [Salmonella enterica subsp. enterica serovar Typhimurium]
FTTAREQGDEMADIKRMFTPEFRNRLDATISFRSLDEEIIMRVVDKFLMQLEEQLHEKKVDAIFTEKLRRFLAKKGFDPRKAEKIEDRVLHPEEYWQDGDRVALSYRVNASGMTMAVVADHIVDTENEYSSRTLIEPDIAKNVYRVQAKAGVPVTVTKLVSYHTSRGVP